MCLHCKLVNIISNLTSPEHSSNIWIEQAQAGYCNHDADDSLMGGLVAYFAPNHLPLTNTCLIPDFWECGI